MRRYGGTAMMSDGTWVSFGGLKTYASIKNGDWNIPAEFFKNDQWYTGPKLGRTLWK